MDLSAEEIAQLKAVHGPLFRVVIDYTVCYFRTITRAEAAEIGVADGVLDAAVEDQLFLTALVWPALNLDAIAPGDVSVVAQKIMVESGFDGASGLTKQLSAARDRHTVFHSIAATICAAFPALLPADLDPLPIDRLMDLLVMADEVHTVKMLVAGGGYSELRFEDPKQTVSTAQMHDKDAALRAQLEGAAAAAGFVAGEVEVGPQQ